ncbi:hypothetical protein [Variovorax ginsengisoli]|uniref:Uncharacterized protein n=1 Tax=Variovorax ginsengisoli TaxID=363844 RepID=A0ABT8SBM7_9BURK|nr:hypothetical protein [Variovorax ginsengisoli]MDN8617149.1 hypothetical protein [Variovorax ginsengisoli]MDO1536319.1 hypothetical protein [Variovorax ginsengisoli]
MSSFKTQALLRRVAATAGPERSFWKAVGALAQEPRPNWGLDLHAGRQPLATDAFVYLVNTSNLWVASAAMSPAQLVAVKNEVEGGDSHKLRALAAVAMASASQAARAKEGSMASPESLQAFAAGLRAIAAAPGFIATAEQSPELDNHHWILLLYRLVDGEVLAGFGYGDDPIPGMLDRETLIEFVGNMVEMDLEPGALVGETAAAHGGATLADVLVTRPS